MDSKLVDGSNDLYIFAPKIYKDERGYFYEKFNQLSFRDVVGSNLNLFQENESFSFHGTLRGLHYQAHNPQGKLISVIDGEILDVVVDLRESSSTFGQHFSVKINSTDKELLWIPKGYAHGFLVLSKSVIFSYLVDNFYDRKSEQTILWNDPDLNIDWGIENPIVSKKDSQGIKFSEAIYF